MNRKKLFYMSKHRGCKEMDIILGAFADEHLDQLTADELIVYERLLIESDAMIYEAMMKIICDKGSIDSKLQYAQTLLIRIAILHKNRQQLILK